MVMDPSLATGVKPWIISMTLGSKVFSRSFQGLLLLAMAVLLSACEKPIQESVQRGYRGPGMVNTTPTPWKKTLKSTRRRLSCQQAIHPAPKLRRSTKTSRSWVI
jgi:hypothetical protein